jgi:hypothetical protein
MTENVFYPIFLWMVLALVRAVEHPSLGRQALLIASLVGLVATRSQAVVLVPATLVAIALVCALRARADATPVRPRGFLNRLRPYWLTLLTLGSLPILAAMAQAMRGQSIASMVGDYEVVFSTIRFADVPAYVLYHVAALDLYVGYLPFVALVLLCLRALKRDAAPQAATLAAVTVAMVATLVVSTAVFATAVKPAHVYDRYTFYVAPLLLIAALYELPRVTRSATLWTVVAIAALLPVAIPIAELVPSWRPGSSSAALLWWSLVPEPVADVALVLLGLGAGAAALLVAQRHRARVVVELVLVSLLVTGLASTLRFVSRSNTYADAASSSSQNWIDQAVGAEARVDVLWSGTALRGETGWFSVWENEFFNRSVHTIYALAEPTGRKFDLPEQRVSVDPSTHTVRSGVDGQPISAAYVLTDRLTPVAGRLVARQEGAGMALYAPAGTIRLVGAHADPRWTVRRGGR